MQYAVVMAGGAGTRLWPAARQRTPKQLQKLIFERPLIAETVRRLADRFSPDRILIVTAERYAQAIRDLLPELPPSNVISEPVGRNTAAAIALAAFHIAREDPEGLFAVFPADHVILKPEALFAAVDFAFDLAQHHRVIDIGVPPTHPETGYGYIEIGPEIESRAGLAAHQVQRFVEKPELNQARDYVAAGNYIWNSGMFVWRVEQFLEAMQQHLPNTYRQLKPSFESGDWEDLTSTYAGLEDISVDYAIMEKVSDVVAVPVDFGWRDIGDWAALYDMMGHDERGNAFTNEPVLLDVANSLLLSSTRLVAAIGVEDLIVVDTEDVLLVMPRERAQDVKKVLEKLKEQGQDDYL